MPWSVDLRNHISATFPLPDGITPIPEQDFLEPRWTLAFQDNHLDNQSDFVNGESSETPFTNGDGAAKSDLAETDNIATEGQGDIDMSVSLEENRRLTPETHWQDVRNLVFKTELPADYQPGDVLTIYPENSSDDVDKILEQMGWTDVADRPIHFTSNSPESENVSHTPPPILLPNLHTTLRELLTRNLDLTAVPRRSFFSSIAHFTHDESHRDRLREFTKPEFLDELYDYTTRPRRSILEVLQEFESVQIPWQYAATVLPKLRGRQFSIASGGRLKKSPDGMTQFQLLVAIVQYKTVIKKIRQGVCTRYLAGLNAGTKLQVTLQRGSLSIDEDDAERPVLMIGPGTGVAPLRSLIWERVQLAPRQIPHGQNMDLTAGASDLLFFGCRNQDIDYFYRHEWEDLKGMTSLEVHAAFSRDQKTKCYVQDLIRKHHQSVYDLLQRNCMVYVCGSSGKMPQAVRAALVDVLRLNGLESKEAEDYLARMEKEGRYKQETWS